MEAIIKAIIAIYNFFETTLGWSMIYSYVATGLVIGIILGIIGGILGKIFKG